jgi:hypothetical protein
VLGGDEGARQVFVTAGHTDPRDHHGLTKRATALDAGKRIPVDRMEPRWPVALALCVVFALLVVLPGRVRVFPAWVFYAAWAVGLLPTVLVGLSGGRPFWLRVERMALILFCGLLGLVTCLFLANLLQAIVYRSSEVGGLALLSSSIAIWLVNVLTFSLLYWQIDRGGPEPRMSEAGIRPDWLFAQDEASDRVEPDWRPGFVDYLFLGYSTATSFSATDAAPLTARAKLLMMLQSSISLMTMAVVASRAINILG